MSCAGGKEQFVVLYVYIPVIYLFYEFVSGNLND